MSEHKADVIIVGSGLNSLVCAALLAKRGLKPLVLERNAVLGGCIRTEELFPGFKHELMASWYPLFLGGGAYARLKDDLAAAGVEFLNNGYTTGVITTDGHSLALKQDIADAIQKLDAIAPNDGAVIGQMATEIFEDNAELLFGLLGGSPYQFSTFKLLFKQWRKRGSNQLLHFAANALTPFRSWSQKTLSHALSEALITPWVLHSGLGPQDAGSALIGKLTFAAVVAGGMPVVKGGGSQLVQALARIIEQHGGRLLTHTEVEKIITAQGKAVGVLAQGQRYDATKAVICNVTPTQLYNQLLPDTPAPVKAAANNYHYGRGAMQIHLALNAPPEWDNPELLKVPLVHMATDLNQVSMSVMQAECGLIPSTPTIAIGQPVAVDPSRAPDGQWILWLQLQDMPRQLLGDAAGTITVTAEGWTDALREQVADRVIDRLATVLPNLKSSIIGRKVLSPADLAHLNVNLVEGDIYSGSCSLDQFFWFRPFAKTQQAKGHQTPIKNVYHIGAATHPGPGLGGGSGLLVADLIK